MFGGGEFEGQREREVKEMTIDCSWRVIMLVMVVTVSTAVVAAAAAAAVEWCLSGDFVFYFKPSFERGSRGLRCCNI